LFAKNCVATPIKRRVFLPTVKGRQLKRRDFHRLSLGMGLSPVLAGSAFAQMSTEEVDTPSSPQKPQRTIVANSPRTYNQINQPRKYVAGRKRFSIYWTWSYPWEANRDVANWITGFRR